MKVEERRATVEPLVADRALIARLVGEARCQGLSAEGEGVCWPSCRGWSWSRRITDGFHSQCSDCRGWVTVIADMGDEVDHR